jgi:hypothetical protein
LALDILASRDLENGFSMSESPATRSCVGGIDDDQVWPVLGRVFFQPAEDEPTEDQRPPVRLMILIVVDNAPQWS